jgi:purine nucleosidase
MPFPPLSDLRRLEMLEPPTSKVQIVLDTDTANEIDDQFAVTYALLSPEKIGVEAIYAAPFENHITTPAEGMERSYDEIVRVVGHLGLPNNPPILKGSTRWLPAPDQPVVSAAAEDLIARAKMEREGPLYVVAIGAIPNVASALLLAPEIIERIIVVWLGGNPYYWHKATEYNVYQDLHAGRIIFDSGVPFVHIPAFNVTEHLRTNLTEIEQYVKPHGAIGRYLYDIYLGHADDHFARTKEIWDIGAIAWLINAAWVESVIIHSPILTDVQTWSHNPHRHLIREVLTLKRDAIFGDLFRKLAKHGAS